MPHDRPTQAAFRVPSVSAEAMRTLAVMCADPNQIHLDPAAAEAKGLGPRVVNPGSANLGYVLNALAQLAPAGRVERLHVSFRANVFAEDAVLATAEVQDDPAPEGGRVHCRVALDVEGGARALEGTATIAMPEP